MPLSLAEYRPSQWRELENGLEDRAARDRARAALKTVLDEARPDGGAIDDELKRIAQKLTRMRFWHRLTQMELVDLFGNARHETIEIFKRHMPAEYAVSLMRKLTLGSDYVLGADPLEDQMSFPYVEVEQGTGMYVQVRMKPHREHRVLFRDAETGRFIAFEPEGAGVLTDVLGKSFSNKETGAAPPEGPRPATLGPRKRRVRY